MVVVVIAVNLCPCVPFFIYFYNCFLDKGCHKGAKPESLQMSQSLSKHLGPKVNTWNKNYITANPWAHWRNYYLSICESSFVCEQILVCAFFFWQYTSQLTSMMPCATYHLTVSMSPLCELSHSVSFQLAGYCFSNYGRLLLWWQWGHRTIPLQFLPQSDSDAWQIGLFDFCHFPKILHCRCVGAEDFWELHECFVSTSENITSVRPVSINSREGCLSFNVFVCYQFHCPLPQLCKSPSVMHVCLCSPKE